MITFNIKKMRIGIYLGSFDPIHNGHLEAISSALTVGKCDKVIVVPTMHNPWKKHAPANIEDRAEMIRLATSQFGDAVEVSTIESRLKPPYFSCNTLEALRNEYPKDFLFVIVGSDAFNDLEKWHDFHSRILPYFGFIDLERKGVDTTPQRTDFESVRRVHVKTSLDVNVSSTEIRDMIANGVQDIPNMPQNVAEYIFNKGLYQN